MAPAEVVDHIVAWQRGRTEEEREALMWSESNHRSLCVSCHNAKTAREDMDTKQRNGRGGPHLYPHGEQPRSGFTQARSGFDLKGGGNG